MLNMAEYGPGLLWKNHQKSEHGENLYMDLYGIISLCWS